MLCSCRKKIKKNNKYICWIVKFMLSTHFVQGKIVGCVGWWWGYEYSGEGIRSGCWNGQAEWLEEGTTGPALRTATKIPFIYSFSGNSATSAPISTFMCLWVIYIDPGAVFIFPPAEQAGRSWEYINRSQTHDCGNWDWDPDIPILGIFVSKFR